MAANIINWGALGAAEIAREHTIPAIVAAENSRPYALASRWCGVPDALVEQFGFETGYGDYDALLADPVVDEVYLPLPNDRHAEWTIKAARAGKRVMCEKPAALTAAQTREAIAACNDLLGEPDRVATMARFAGPQAAEMSAAVVLGYDSGAKGSFDCGMDATGRHAYEVYGTAGTIRVHKAFVPQADGDGPIDIVDADGQVRREQVTSFQYSNGVAHFADCVLTGKTPDYALASVLANMRVLDACIESVTSGRVVALEKQQ